MNNLERTLRITEIFHSIQGESTQTGRPCSFVRLTACNLRCVWCDTAYAFEGGEDLTIGEIRKRVLSHRAPLALITGGEPLLQEAALDLMAALLEDGKEVMVETGGSLDIAPVDRRVRIVMDLKCPGSGMAGKNRWENLDHLKPTDEIKFVVANRADYEWARGVIRDRELPGRWTVLLSPAFGMLEPRSLAGWILEDRLDARLQLQIHKILWPSDARGV